MRLCMAVNFNVVLLFGPPFSGKSQHCLKKYVPAGFERICPAELFITNRDLGLRDISIQVTRLLEKGKKIVIDDENVLAKTRKSYISFIQRKFSKCKFHLVKLCPTYGYLQCMWSREFVLASGRDLQGLCKDHHIAKWYDKDRQDNSCVNNMNVDEPNPDEGFSIDNQHSLLTAVTPFKFEVSALFLQWEGISSQNDLHLVNKTAKICNEWEVFNPCGHIFIICDGQNVSKGLLTATNEETAVQTFTAQLVSEVSVPVYVFQLHSVIEAGVFCIPPQPGILAYLQKRHCLNLHCRVLGWDPRKETGESQGSLFYKSQTTVYLYASSGHKNMAENAGVRYIKFGRVLQHPKLVVTGHAAETPSIPLMLQKLVLQSNGSDQTAQIPLYNIIIEFRNNFVKRELPWGRREFLFARNLDTIEKFQAMYSRNATPVSEAESRIEQLRSGNATKITLQSSSVQDGQTARDLPKWMLRKTKSDVASSLEKSYSTSSAEGKSRKRMTVYLMTEKELVESAKELLRQTGREDILVKIENDLKIKVESETNKKPTDKDSNLDISISTLVPEAANQNEAEKEEIKKLKIAIETCIKDTSVKTAVKRTHKDNNSDVSISTPVFEDRSLTLNEVVKKDSRHDNVKDRIEAPSEVISHPVCSNMEDIGAMLDSLFDVKSQPTESVIQKKPRLDFWDEDEMT